MTDMEFGSGFVKKSGEAVTTVLTEGLAVATGFVVAGATGKAVENAVKKGVNKDSSTTDKFIAFAANVAPKVGVYALLRSVGPEDPQRPQNMSELMLVDAKKATVASIFVDGLMRAGNKGAPGVGFSIFGYDIMSGSKVNSIGTMTPQMQENVQKVLQENSTLRNQLNQALGKLASVGNKIQTAQAVQTQYPQDHGTKFGMMASATVGEAADERNKRFGTMEAPLIEERHKRFGQMNESETSKLFGMR